MKPDEGVLILKFLLPMLRDEAGTTRKVLAAMPDSGLDYRPDPKARTPIELAWHIAASEAWMLDGVLKGEFEGQDEPLPEHVRKPAEVLKWYNENIPPRLDKLEQLSGEQATRKIPFFGVLNEPAVAYLAMMIHHSAHHRGQLSTYLRPMGGKVPDIYGGSADEPFQMP